MPLHPHPTTEKTKTDPAKTKQTKNSNLKENRYRCSTVLTEASVIKDLAQRFEVAMARFEREKDESVFFSLLPGLLKFSINIMSIATMINPTRLRPVLCTDLVE
jgi:cyclophilin family peptidyl-prolyl cis-trans isomerase